MVDFTKQLAELWKSVDTEEKKTYQDAAAQAKFKYQEDVCKMTHELFLHTLGSTLEATPYRFFCTRRSRPGSCEHLVASPKRLSAPKYISS
jgi:hypothetical protein